MVLPWCRDDVGANRLIGAEQFIDHEVWGLSYVAMALISSYASMIAAFGTR